MIQINDVSYKILYLYVIALLALQISSPYQMLQSLLLYSFIGAGAIMLLKGGKVLLSPYTMGYGFFLLYCFIQTVFIQKNYALTTLYDCFTCFVLVILITNTLERPKQLKQIMYAIIIGGALFSLIVFSYYQFSLARIMSDVSSELRIGYMLTNPNFIGIICSYGFCLSLFLIGDHLEAKNYWVSLGLFGAILLCGGFSLLSGSRMPYLNIAIGLLVLFFFRLRKRLTLKRVAISSALLALGIFLFLNLEAFSWSRHRLLQMILLLTGEGTSEGSMNHRQMLLEEGLRLFAQAPFFGNGLETVRSQMGFNSHNNYVEILANNGIVGFILYYASYFINFVSLFYVRNKESTLFQIMLFTLLSTIVGEVAQITYYDRFTQLKLVLVSSYLLMELSTRGEGLHVQKNRIKEY